MTEVGSGASPPEAAGWEQASEAVDRPRAWWLPHTSLSPRFPLYSRANADEVLPGLVSPLGASLSWVPALLPGWRDGNRELGALSDLEAADPVNPCAAFRGGFLYVNASLVRVFGIRSGVGVEAVDAAYFAGRPGSPPHDPDPADLDPGATARAAEHLGWVLAVEHWTDLDRARDAAAALRRERPPLTELLGPALVARARDAWPLLREAFRVHAVTTTDAAVGPGVLRNLLADRDPVLVPELLGAADDVDSEVMLHHLWGIARLSRTCPLDAIAGDPVEVLVRLLRARGGPADVEKMRVAILGFLAEYGSRGPDEWDLAAPSWEVEPRPLVAAILQLRERSDADDPSVGHGRAAARRDAALQQARTLLRGEPGAADLLERVHRASLRSFAWRERSKLACMRVLHEQRMAVRELGRRAERAGHVERADDVFFLVEGELDEFAADAASFGVELAARRQEWRATAASPPPYFVSAHGEVVVQAGSCAVCGTAHRPAVPGDVLGGAAGAAGVAVGRVRVVSDPGAAADVGPDDVLVAERTDPSWTPLFLLACAVVAGTGALASHTVIVGRELGLPCVVGVHGAVDRLPDGALVEVDGGRGTVTVLPG